MLALDLDGTLAIDNHQVLPATRDALKHLHDADVEVVMSLIISVLRCLRSATAVH
jgi:hydroxymethylpyrimidine pyrophosphatase-like HAD family hydrolase